jgi:hypothetical protein
VVDAFVRVLGADRDYAFRTRDLSEGGLFLYTRVGHLYPFSIGGEVSIELHDLAEVVVLRGVIARIVSPGSPESEHYPLGFGIRLVAGDDAETAKLRALLERARASANRG